jgi:hypothetical protein
MDANCTPTVSSNLKLNKLVAKGVLAWVSMVRKDLSNIKSLSEFKSGEVLVTLAKILLTGILEKEKAEYGTETDEWRQLLATDSNQLRTAENRFAYLHYICKNTLKVNRDISTALAKQGDEFELARVNIVMFNKRIVFNLF